MGFDKELKLGDTFQELPKSKFQVQHADNIGHFPFYTSGDSVLTHSEFNVDDEIIFLATGGKANVKFHSGKAAYSTDTYAIKGKDHSSKYLFYLLLKNLSFIDKNFFSGSGLKHLQKKDFRNWLLNFPDDTNEEERIVQFLSTLDRAIDYTKQLIAKYQRLKTGLLHDLLTRGIDEHGNLRSEKTHQFKASKLGRIPVDWEYKNIGSLIAYLGSGVTPRGGSKIYKKEGILLIRSQNVYPGYFELDDVAFIDEEINNTMLRSEIFEYDVLLNITGASIGRCVYVPKGFYKANVNQHVCAIRLQNKTENKAAFLQAFLNSIYGQNQIIRFNAGGNREGLNYSQIKAMELPWPNNEQEFERIRIIIEKADNYLNVNQNNLTKLQSLKAGLMQDLLSGKV